MKKFTQVYQSSVLIIGALSLMVMCWYQRREINTLKEENVKVKFESESLQGGDITKTQTIDSLQKRCDSLYDELFPAQIELGRYQVAYEIFSQRNPKAASQYGDIISNETE
jgi:hypothetical protein